MANFFQVTCFRQHKNMVVEKNIRVTKNFYKNQWLPDITLNRKHLPKQVVPMTYTLEKTFFGPATFEGF